MQIGTLEPVSNRATWSESAEIYDDDTNEPFDISAATEIKVQVCEPRSGSAVLSASLTGSTVSIEDETGVFSWTFTASQMSSLDAPKTYDIGVTATIAGTVVQLIIGKLPVIEGYVT